MKAVMKSKPAALLTLISLLLICSNGSKMFSQESGAVIRAEVALVNIVFTVLDKEGRHLRGFKQSDFQVFEDKKRQKIEYFNQLGKGSDVPLTIAMLIDTSESVKDKIEIEKATAADFFKEILRPGKDSALIYQFNNDVMLVQDLTKDPEILTKALDKLKAESVTSLNEAVYKAANKLSKENGRKIILVISDGDDTGSMIKEPQAIAAAQRGDVVIYGVGVKGTGAIGTNFKALKNFAKETGGVVFTPHSKLSEIQSAFQSIMREIQGQYSLAYVSTNPKKDGTYRTIELRCKTRGVQIHARKGYYAPKE
jgi:VWFA-related protein